MMLLFSSKTSVLRIRPSQGAVDSSIPARFQRTILRPSLTRPEQEVIVHNISDALSDPARSSIASSSGHSSPSPAMVSHNMPKSSTFGFDRVLEEGCNQTKTYEVVAKSAVDKFIQGINVTILAYGQTSSGKSYSMGTTGLDDDYALPDSDVADRIGIIPRAAHDLFGKVDRVRSENGRDAEWECRLTFLELYNEDLIDLLSPVPHADAPPILIREDKGRILWSGLREVKVNSVDEVMKWLKLGSEKRRTGETSMNKDSSRSHAIFSLTLVQRRRASESLGLGLGLTLKVPQRPMSVAGMPINNSHRSPTPTSARSGRNSVTSISHRTTPSNNDSNQMIEVVSKFHFVDLAGSERLKRTGALGDRMKEGISINSGLSALGNVIQALADNKVKQSHVPYRDSKLTRLLQDSLGGNSFTIMLACVSSIEYNLNETINTLRYGSRARSIKNRAQINATEVGWDDLEYLQTTVLRLRKDLAEFKKQVIESGPIIPSAENTDSDIKQYDQMKILQEKLEEARSELRSVRLKRELERASNAIPSDETKPFNELVEPIINEYEGTITSMEEEISRLKEAWFICNELVHDQQHKISEKDQVIAVQEEYIAELRLRVDKLLDREKSAEPHISECEERLKTYQDQEIVDKEKLAEAKQDLHKHRDTAATQLGYISTLESALGQSQKENTEFSSTIKVLEIMVTSKEGEIEALRQRLKLLDIGSEMNNVLREIESKDERVFHPERKLEESVKQCDELASERDSLRSDVKGSGPYLILPKHEMEPTEVSETSSEKVSGTPLKEGTELSAGTSQHADDSLDLETMSAMYRAALTEISMLAKQLEQVRLISQSHVDINDESDEDVLAERSASEDSSEKKSAKTIHRRFRSSSVVGLSIKTKIKEDFRSGKRRRSQVFAPSRSLSEELSLSPFSQSHTGGQSLLSPVSSRQSLPAFANQRSVPSLETETEQLQRALRTRDEEIAEPVKSLCDLHGISSRQSIAVPPTQVLDSSNDESGPQHETSFEDPASSTVPNSLCHTTSTENVPKTPAMSRSPDSVPLTPLTAHEFNISCGSLSPHVEDNREGSDLKRLDQLMRRVVHLGGLKNTD